MSSAEPNLLPGGPRVARKALRRVGPPAFLLLFSLLSEAPVSAQVGAFEELDRIRAAYGDLGEFSDHGEIVRRTRRESGAETREDFQFELARDARGGFRFLLRSRESSDQVVWERGGEAFRFDGDLGQHRPVSSAAAEVFRLLGEGGQDALLVVALLLELPQAIPDAEAAAVEEVDWKGGAARRVRLSALGGSLETELTTDARSGLLHRVKVVFHGRYPGPGSPAATGEPALEVEISHHPRPGTLPQAANWLQPPDGSRRVEEWDLAAASAREGDSGASMASGEFGETLEVALITYRLRVLRPDGSPVRDLLPENFRVRLGRRELEVSAVDWVESGSSPAADLPPEVLAESGITLPPPGKLLVFFVQAGLQGGRMLGHLKQIPHARALLESLGRDDRVAVVSFDSHLKLRLDFTRDQRRVMESLSQAIRFGKKVAPLPAGRYPSLARSFDYEAARKAATPERALELTAHALTPLLGEKAVVFVGWGVGRFDKGGVSFSRQYDRARDALDRANATVSVLDISQADFHTLELGLQQVAHDTGGTYERVFRRGVIATERLARTLEGYYLLTFENPNPRETPRRSKLRVKLRGARGEVHLGQGPEP